jgi:hypothetical protein
VSATSPDDGPDLGGWIHIYVQGRPSGDVHLVPLDDLRTHDEECCWCRPRDETLSDGSVLTIHNSLDGREAYERGELKLQ